MAHARDALWESGYDESVEVNQRALIDKVLARYSAEFTVFRELLQNSDDAGAKAAEIRFETKEFLDSGRPTNAEQTSIPSEGKQDLDRKAALVHSWTFKNDGMYFKDEDWNRLKKIAEGNPDEEKIGAFGVGFYSLFSVTEEPSVTSGGQWMRFYWKDGKDQLFVRRGILPDSGPDKDPWTTFEMFLREPAPIPKAFDLARFLATSITFMKQLADVSIFLDNTRIARVAKQPGTPKSIAVPKGLKNVSPRGIMQVSGIHTTPLLIKAELIRWVYLAGSEKMALRKGATKPAPTPASGSFFSSLFASFSGVNTPQRAPTPVPPPIVEEIDPTTIIVTSLVLSILSADVAVTLDQKTRSELHRSTKKNPPATMRYDVIYTGKDEYDASVKDEEKQPEKTGSVFQGLRSDVDGTGSARIFIGHGTGQTTGVAGHMAARFIPTVERESIDLEDRTVAVWNEELLHVGGFLTRAGYEVEMEQIRLLWPKGTTSTTSDNDLTVGLRARAMHVMKFFTFRQSTPRAEVSQKMEAAFFSCGIRHPFPLVSTAGVRDAGDVRLPDPAFSEFLKELPVVPQEVLSGAGQMIARLQERGLVKNVEFMDVLRELRSRPLTEGEMVACCKWWIGVQNQGVAGNLVRIRTELLNAALLCIGEKGTADERIIQMSSIQQYLNTRTMGVIPTDGPLPAHLLPVSISRHLDPSQISAAFPWKEFTTVDWLRHITSATQLSVEFDITKSPQWAERVFQVLVRMWPNMAKGAQEEAASLLQAKPCVPTSAGMKSPQEAYFQSVVIFKDLPIVQMPSNTPVKGVLERVLVAIGVRKHVELQIVFNRMIKTGDWTIADLVKYLVSIQSTLTPLELDRLRATAAFPKESGATGLDDGTSVRYKASELYEPVDIFRQLGLPVIDWGQQQKWRAKSEEAKFLHNLGLQRFPPLPTILQLAANPDPIIRPVALRYFLDNIATKYSDYDPNNFVQVPFIPAVKDGKSYMGKPSEVNASPEWAALGFAVIEPSFKDDALTRLKIREHPPTAALVNLLQRSPPTTDAVARTWFDVLAGRIAEFTPPQLTVLSQTPIVPVANQEQKTTRMISPSQCYLRRQSEAQLHAKWFTFVDFGTRANQFLSACGSKQEPSVEEIAKIILDDPRKFYELAGGRDSYLIELRNIAVNHRLFTSGTMSRLKRASILLGSRRVNKVKSMEKLSDDSADIEEEDWEYENDLLPASQIAVADDLNEYQLFGSSVFIAPQEDLLEVFYLQLGSKLLSSLVKEEHRTTAQIQSSRKAIQIRSLILERLPLFLHEHTHATPRIKYSWLNDERHFLVKSFGRLTVVKTLQFGSIRASQTQDSSAIARRDTGGVIELWLADNDQIDMYEVSSSICRILFDSPKANDILLFMTILSTDLRSLKRRGYNVDRILRQQQAQRAAKEEAMKKSNSTALVSHKAESGSAVPVQSANALAAQPGSPEKQAEVSAFGPLDMFKRMSSAIPLDSWKRRQSALLNANRVSRDESSPLLPGHEDHDGEGAVSAHAGASSHLATSQAGSRSASPMPGAPLSISGDANHGGGGVTSRNRIGSVVDMAINACREEKSQHIQSRENQQIVKEALNQGYCDGTGESLNLTLVGSMEDFKVYAAPDIVNMSSIMTAKRDTIARFIYVILPLLEVYKLPRSSIHFYYDQSGQRIAFNRNASLFLSVRYFEGWHDGAVQQGGMKEAFISWYFTLAHEIAHNLVGPHNSEHEFYFSAISEASLPDFVTLLSTRT